MIVMMIKIVMTIMIELVMMIEIVMTNVILMVMMIRMDTTMMVLLLLQQLRAAQHQSKIVIMRLKIMVLMKKLAMVKPGDHCEITMIMAQMPEIAMLSKMMLRIEIEYVGTTTNGI